jgi:hypothetical protein
MSLRVMTIVGLLVLVVGVIVLWLVPTTTSQPRSTKPIGTNAVSHGGSSTAGQPKSRIDTSDVVSPREEAGTPRR